MAWSEMLQHVALLFVILIILIRLGRIENKLFKEKKKEKHSG